MDNKTINKIYEKNSMFFTYLQSRKTLSIVINKSNPNVKFFHSANIKTVFDIKIFILKYSFRNKKEKIVALDKQIENLFKDLNSPGIKDLLEKEINSELLGEVVSIKKHIFSKVFYNLVKKDIDNYFKKLQTEERFQNEFNSFYKKYDNLLYNAIFKRRDYLKKDKDEIKKESKFINSFISELWLFINDKTFNYYSSKIELHVKNKVLFSYPLFSFKNIIIPADGIQKSGQNFLLVAYNSEYQKNKKDILNQVETLREEIKEARKENNKELENKLIEIYRETISQIEKDIIDSYFFSADSDSGLEIEKTIKKLEKMLENI